MVADVVQAALQALTATVSGDSKEEGFAQEGFCRDGKPGQNDLYNSAQVLNTESRLDFMLHLRAVRNRVERLIDGAEIPALAAALKPEYGILAHSSCARRQGADWTVPIEGWMFRRNEGRHKTRLAFCRKVLIEMAIGLDTEAFDEAAKRRFEERGRLIFRNICFRGGEFGRQLEVRFGGPDGGDRWRPLPEKTDFHGRVDCELRLTQEEAERFTSGDGSVLLEMRCATKLSVPATTTSRVHLVEEEGLSIISDIDDTVKVTEVFLGKGSVVRKTFYDEFEAVSGMAELFQDWSRTSPGMSFHFVSNSPQELYEPLRDMLQDSGFPSAALHLRILGSRGKERKEFKKRTILQLLGQFPKRRFILVGDSGEGDARIYADVHRRSPNQVAKILIRQVSANNPLEPAVFAGIDDSLWQVFRDPIEVGPQVVAPLMKEPEAA